MKVKVNQSQVKKMLSQHTSLHWISKTLGVPYSVVQDIRDGHDRPEYVTRNKWRGMGKPDWMCTALGCSNPKGEGLRFLCDSCYHGRTNDVAFEHDVGAVSSARRSAA